MRTFIRDPFASTVLLPRRTFLKGVAASAAVCASGGHLLGNSTAPDPKPTAPYTGPNVIIVRFGGGVRRRETIDPANTYAPFLCHELTKRGTLFPQMEVSSVAHVEREDGQGRKEKIDTSHGQGTLYILTGKYERFHDIERKFLAERFESKAPTVFEYFRKQFNVPDHETLIVNSEDRTNEEFYTFSNHHLFGVHYRSNVLSLYRFKTYLLRRSIEEGKWQGSELAKKRKELAKLEEVDFRQTERGGQTAEIQSFWNRWQKHYGTTGLVNPRGDRLLTELTIRALRELRPKLIMVNYCDPDYVHWGNIHHYTRGIAVIDQGIRELVATVEGDEHYRNNTVFVIVPDCGRDTNPLAAVPCQHHSNSRSAHEIFTLMFGPGIDRGRVVDKVVDQCSVAPTIGAIMGFKAPFSEGPVLEQALA